MVANKSGVTYAQSMYTVSVSVYFSEKKSNKGKCMSYVFILQSFVICHIHIW